MPEMTNTMQTVGWIGLGRMGGPMARHLLRAGYRVQGFDLAPDAVEQHSKAGGAVSASVGDAARGADFVVTMLNSDESLQRVVEGADGLLALLRPPAVFLDMSTSRVGTIRRMAAHFAERHIPLLDAPVTGGVQGADQATLDIMVGGDVEAFERCRALLAAMSRKVTYVGASGAGLLAKYVNQIVMAATFCAASEGLALATKGGADPARVWDAISSGLAASPLLASTVQSIASESYGEAAELMLFYKDTAYALGAGTDLAAWLPMTSQAHEAFKLAVQAGFGGGNAPGVAQLWEQLMDVRLRTE